MSIPRILFTELQCEGIEHVKFNSALIETFSYTYEKSLFDFIGEKNHCKSINKELLGECIDSYTFLKSSQSKKHFNHNFYKTIQLFNHLRRKNYNLVVILSLNNHLLILLKLLFLFTRHNVIFIAHSELELLNDKRKKILFKNFFSFKNNYLRYNVARFKFLFLSEKIMNNVIKISPGIQKHALYFNHPYRFDNNFVEDYKERDNKINIGFIGFAHENKGIKDFLELSNIFSLDYKFSIIGSIDSKIDLANSKRVQIIDNVADRKNYINKVKDLDYIFMPYSRDKYNFYFSGTALDAVEMNIPIIAYRNKFSEYFFNECGEIGFIIESFSEALKVLSKIKDKEIYFKNIEYMFFKKNLKQAKLKFSTGYNSNILKQQNYEFLK
jgi:hypothetical protein